MRLLFISLLFMVSMLPAKSTLRKPPKRNSIIQSAINTKEVFSKLFNAASLYFSSTHANSTRLDTDKTEIDRQKELFGHELTIELIGEDNPSVQLNSYRPTLYFHGWTDKKNSAYLMKHYCDVLPGLVITFNFPDAHGLLSLIKNTNFGQALDVSAALYVLNYAVQKLKLSEIDLFGVSRGGATVINMISVLTNNIDQHQEILSKLDIDDTQRKKLLQVIQKGTVTLDCPLRDMNSAISHRFPEFITKNFWPHKAISKMTLYDYQGLQAVESAQMFAGLGLKTLIHFQHNDNVVTNEDEDVLYNIFAKHNPQHTYLVLGDDGGHIHTHDALSKTIHTFKRKYGSSFDQEYDASYQAIYDHTKKEEYPGHTLLQVSDAQPYIKQYYHLCKNQV